MKRGTRNRKHRSKSGQSLIEVLLALGMAVVIVTSITALIVFTLDNASFRKNQNLANAYAQEGMEVVRKIRDSSWSYFDSLNGWFCLAGNSTALVSRGGSDCDGEGNVGIFIREIRSQAGGSDCGASNRKITVSVYWLDGKCNSGSFCHKAELISCFAQNQTVAAP